MKSIALSVFLCFALLPAMPRLSNVVNSAPAANQPVQVNADCANETDPASALALYYSTDAQASWTRLTMTRRTEPGFDSTHQASFPLGASGTVWYHVRAVSGSNYATQSPFNAANAWPPGNNLLASIADEPAGDARDPEGNWVDLVGANVGYSADHFYAMLINNDDEWPTYRFPQPWFIYSLGFINPDAASDTWVFTMSYANIPGVFTTGLYLINRYTATYTRIADAEARTSGNQLHLRAPVSSFTNDPHFGPWPNSTGYLAAAATTQAIYPLGGSQLRDTTNSARYYADRTPRFTIGVNRPPELTGSVSPDTGTSSTLFFFTAWYTDPDSNLPVRHQLLVDADTFDMVPSGHEYWLPTRFGRIQSFDPGTHYFRGVFSDGAAEVTTPLDSFFVIGTSVSEAIPPAARSWLSAVPNPFRDRVTLSTSQARLRNPPSTIAIYNPNGRLLRTIPLPPGAGCIVWDGTDLTGLPLPPGVYFCRQSNTPGSTPLFKVRP